MVRVIHPPQPPPADVSEASFQLLVTDLAQYCGWEIYHTFDSRRSNPGWPDLVLARECWPQRARALFVEIKTERGRLSREQARWGELLLRAGLDYRLWRPSSWQEVCDTLTMVDGCGARAE